MGTSALGTMGGLPTGLVRGGWDPWQQQLLLQGAPAPEHGATGWVPGECRALRAARPLLCVPAWCSPRLKGFSPLRARVVPFWSARKA